MSGDYSRVRFDPGADIAGVLMQQGRVQLDSDWNEWAAVLDRRLRAESVDTLGVHPAPDIAGVAVVSPQTPDAFKIEPAGGKITIGRGRMYVDGLLAENHGGGTPEFDPVLAELRGKGPRAYQDQPYFPNPPALPQSGPALAYLEVWQRELTHLQQPNLVESAVGVDTTTRLQTVWQVRLLTDVGSADCSTPDAEINHWKELTRPSAGRMSIKAEGVPPNLDPCQLPPGGGYRGLENQLYRIEIHDGGGVGTATFKWSRDNASVASSVTEIVSQTATATELRLASLGRDSVLRFSTGDWVEILDDRLELGGENGDPARRRGVMRKITVDDARQTITFSPALPANLIPAGGDDTLAARHTRVRRWDQKGTVRDANSDATNNIIIDLDSAESKGLIPVPEEGVWVVLEHGIQIQFSLAPASGGFRCGDFWVSAARTANASVETYNAMPPRGIHRHYARLAMVTFPMQAGVDIPDCRNHWPPECGGCCTVNVAPGESIQAAIDSLPGEGGCVCLKTGVHTIGATLHIHGSRIILRGESPGAIVRSTGLASILQIGGGTVWVSDIIIEGIRFESSHTGTATTANPVVGELAAMLDTENSPVPLLALSRCTRVRVEHCILSAEMLQPSIMQQRSMIAGIWIEDAGEIDIIDNRFQSLHFGIRAGNCKSRLHIAENLVAGFTANLSGGADNSPVGYSGVSVENDAAADCRIEGNQFSNFWTAVRLRPGADGSVVSGNRILRNPLNTSGEMPIGIIQLRQYLDERLYAIEVEAAGCTVSNNYIDLRSAIWGGVRVSGRKVTVAGNTLDASEKTKMLHGYRDEAVAVALNASADMSTNMSTAKLRALLPATIYCLPSAAKGVAADHALVRDNQVLGPQTGIVISGIAGASVSGNHVDGDSSWYGICADDCTDSRIENNDVRNAIFAMHLAAGERNRVRGNRIIQAVTGITSMQETNLEICGNTLQSCMVLGMALFVRGATAVLGNRVFNCGYAPIFSVGIGVVSEGILAPASDAHLRIENCEVIDTGVASDGAQATTTSTIGIGGWVPACQISGNRVGYTRADKLDPAQEHRALWLTGPIALCYRTPSGEFIQASGSAQVHGNHLRGPGHTHLVEFMRADYPIPGNPLFLTLTLCFEKVIFSNNVCDHLSEQNATFPNSSVALWGGDLIAMGNHVKAAIGFNSMSLSNRLKIALMGNVTTGDYINAGTAVTPSPIDSFNVKI